MCIGSAVILSSLSAGRVERWRLDDRGQEELCHSFSVKCQVSTVPSIIPYGEISPVRLQAHVLPVTCSLPLWFTASFVTANTAQLLLDSREPNSPQGQYSQASMPTVTTQAQRSFTHPTYYHRRHRYYDLIRASALPNTSSVGISHSARRTDRGGRSLLCIAVTMTVPLPLHRGAAKTHPPSLILAYCLHHSATDSTLPVSHKPRSRGSTSRCLRQFQILVTAQTLASPPAWSRLATASALPSGLSHRRLLNL